MAKSYYKKFIFTIYKCHENNQLNSFIQFCVCSFPLKKQKYQLIENQLVLKSKLIKISKLFVSVVLPGLFIISCNTIMEKRKSIDPYTSWEIYRGDEGNNAYSGLDQINRENVDYLELARIYRTGDNKSGTSIQCNPLMIDDILFVTSAGLKMIALDAATGKVQWEYDPSSSRKEIVSAVGGTNRGLTYWSDGIDKRLFYCVMNEIQAIDATTGKQIADFGSNGSVDLRVGLDREIDLKTAFIRNTSPGVIYNDLIIMGSSVNESHGSLPGHIRAYNVRNGEIR